MAKVSMHPAFTGIRKKIGSLVFYNSGGDTLVRSAGSWTDPQTEKQMEKRGTMTSVGGMWKGCPQVIKQSWRVLAVQARVNGYNMFMQANFERLENGDHCILSMEMGQEQPVHVEAAPGGKGEISCRVAHPQGTQSYLTVFTHPAEKSPSRESLACHRAGYGVGGCIISGLEPGKAYYVYAVLSDAPPEEAVAVSASVCARSTAGV